VNLIEVRRSIAALGKESWLLFIALSVVNASNYIFHIAVSRVLGPAEYGALGSVLAILTVVSVPLAAIQATVARRIASSDAPDSAAEWRDAFRALLPFAVGLSGALALISPLLAMFLRLDSWITSLILALYVTPAILISVLRGALQGQLRFARLAVASVFPVLVRLMVGFAAVQGGAGVPGAVGASVVAEGVGVVLTLALLGNRPPLFERSRKAAAWLREVGPVCMSLAATWALIELDLVLARHFLQPDDAGNYAAAGLLARSVLFVPGAVSLIALPHFSMYRGRGTEAYRWLVACSAVVAALSTATALVLLFAGDQIVSLTYGEMFARASDVLVLASTAMAGFGIVNLLVHFHIAARSRLPSLLWFAGLVEGAAVFFLHDSPREIAYVAAIVSWGLAIAGFVATRSMALSIPGLSRLPVDLTVHRRPAPTEPGRPELSLIVPSHTVGPQMNGSLAELISKLNAVDKTFEVIVVSDGSTQWSTEAIRDLPESVSVVHYPHRQGKGVALRVGMSRASGRYVAFIDADGELDSSEFKSFLVLMNLYEPDLIIGSKRHPLSVVDYPVSRRIMSWIYHRLVRIMFGLNVRDTQTGMKLIRRDVLDAVLPRMLEKRFAFDLEFLVVARSLGYTRVLEAPVRLTYKFKSTVALKDVVYILLDTAAIFYRRYILRYYDHIPAGLAPDDITVVDSSLHETQTQQSLRG
jgi:O-antigen/teichoic acid export membrane protein